MFTNFFLELRQAKVPVSIKEYLALMEAMDKHVADYNVDTYENWTVLNASSDYLNISAVRIIITFVNPLAGQPSQPATLTVERVIQVMARGGLHT